MAAVVAMAPTVLKITGKEGVATYPDAAKVVNRNSYMNDDAPWSRHLTRQGSLPLTSIQC